MPATYADPWFETVREMTKRLMAVSTISPDVAGENRCAQLIQSLLTEPDEQGRATSLEPELWATGDGRHNVACLLRGQPGSARTLILIAHYDVVGIDEFRAIDPQGTGEIAFHPDALRELLMQSVRPGNGGDVLHDLHAVERGPSGEEPVWMFGRGSVDMKSGLAIHIALMRQFSRQPDLLAGNLLFLASPDEENESAGILSALPRLVALREALALEYLGVINTDYTAPRSSDETERYIYTGVVGKLLPSFYIVGDPTHVGEPFGGIDANQLAAELVRRLNLNTSLSDTYPAGASTPTEVAVPPVTLKLRDLKPSYNVQTSAEAFVYINWLTYTYSPESALERLEQEASAALRAVFADRDARYAEFRGRGPRPKQYVPLVLKFSDLCQRVRQKQGWFGPEGLRIFDAWLDAQIRQIAGAPSDDALAIPSATHKADAREVSQQIVARLADKAELVGPAIILFYSPPYYPHIQPSSGVLHNAIMQLLEDDQLNPDRAIQLREFYPYIADISYLQLDGTVEAHLPSLIENMPLYGHGYQLDFESMRALNCPVVNIGPWGKDAHGLYERVHMPYSFRVVPRFIFETICLTLAGTAVQPTTVRALESPSAPNVRVAQVGSTLEAIAPRVTSEYSLLQSVLVHRPGVEIDRLDPKNRGRLLFEDIPFLRKMQLEHDGFCHVLRSEGIEVHYLETMLGDLLQDDRLRQQLMTEVCAAAGQPGLASTLLEEYGPGENLEHLFGGFPATQLATRSSSYEDIDGYLLEPIPNAFFTRDPAAIIGDGWVACKAHFETRVRETILMRFVAEHHPRLAGTNILFGVKAEEDRPFTIEGGDIHVLNREAVMIGVSQRTRAETVALLARKLFAAGKVQRVYEVVIPSDRRYMHLDTVFTIIAQGVVVVYPDVIDRVEHIRRYEPILTRDGELTAQAIRETRKLHTLLADEFASPLTVVNTGGSDLRYSAREQGADGTNVFAIAPGRVISYDRNFHTNTAMRSLGIDVLEIEGSELVRGLGGPRCMAMPLRRA